MATFGWALCWWLGRCHLLPRWHSCFPLFGTDPRASSLTKLWDLPVHASFHSVNCRPCNLCLSFPHICDATIYICIPAEYSLRFNLCLSFIEIESGFWIFIHAIIYYCPFHSFFLCPINCFFFLNFNFTLYYRKMSQMHSELQSLIQWLPIYLLPSHSSYQFFTMSVSLFNPVIFVSYHVKTNLLCIAFKAHPLILP